MGERVELHKVTPLSARNSLQSLVCREGTVRRAAWARGLLERERRGARGKNGRNHAKGGVSAIGATPKVPLDDFEPLLRSVLLHIAMRGFTH